MTNARQDLLHQLRELGVEAVLAQYDGCGDSGQIESLDFGPAKVPGHLATSVKDLFYEVLEELYAGWEINEGAFGQFEWDLQTDKIKLEHSMRVESTEEHVL